MTIAIVLKVQDGIVLASDSAATMIVTDASGNQLGAANVYNNANKLFNLYKGLPIGACTWGAGSIGPASISTLAKDLRERLMGADPKWALDRDTYTIEQVADRLRAFIFDEMYTPAFSSAPTRPALGFSITGYSSGQGLPETYQVLIDDQGVCSGPTLAQDKANTGLMASGAPEPVLRLILGFSPALAGVMQHQLGIPQAQIGPAIQVIQQALEVPLVIPAMPIQDAIDLAEFFVDLAIRFYRFIPSAPIVGGPIEIAAITKHEGFKWVRRKHYYAAELNPVTL